MLQNAHFGTGSDALQQVHGAGVKSNESSIFYAKHHNSQNNRIHANHSPFHNNSKHLHNACQSPAGGDGKRATDRLWKAFLAEMKSTFYGNLGATAFRSALVVVKS